MCLQNTVLFLCRKFVFENSEDNLKDNRMFFKLSERLKKHKAHIKYDKISIWNSKYLMRFL